MQGGTRGIHTGVFMCWMGSPEVYLCCLLKEFSLDVCQSF